MVVDTLSTMNVIMGREWIHTVKGVMPTLHQVMRCQSPNGLYMIDIRGDQSHNRKCYNIENQESRGVRKMTKGQIEKFNRPKGEIPEKGNNK